MSARSVSLISILALMPGIVELMRVRFYGANGPVRAAEFIHRL